MSGVSGSKALIDHFLALADPWQSRKGFYCLEEILTVNPPPPGPKTGRLVDRIPANPHHENPMSLASDSPGIRRFSPCAPGLGRVYSQGSVGLGFAEKGGGLCSRPLSAAESWGSGVFAGTLGFWARRVVFFIGCVLCHRESGREAWAAVCLIAYRRARGLGGFVRLNAWLRLGGGISKRLLVRGNISRRAALGLFTEVEVPYGG